MHPSRAIRGGRSHLLDGRRIIIGISGSIAAIEVPRIIRELIRHGAEVRAVMSAEAARLATPEAIHFASGFPPVTQLTGDVEHVSLLGPGEARADLLLLAPATANTISKIAHGIDDTPVTSCASVALGGGVPVLLAPAMHAHMGQNPAIVENLDRLRRWGVGLIEPVSAEGEEKIATPEEIAAAVLHRLGSGPLAGRRVLVIGGASHERIDDVRAITNESSGATAMALAAQAHYRGAEVELWAGAIRVPIPRFLQSVRWSSVAELDRLVSRRARSIRDAAVVLVPAALSDYTLRAARGKISSSSTPTLHLELSPAVRILPRLRRAAGPRPIVVAFKLESGRSRTSLEKFARQLLADGPADVIVANDVATMGAPVTRAFVAMRGGASEWLEGEKEAVAGRLLDLVSPLLGSGAAKRPSGASSAGARRPRRAADRRR